MTYKIKAIKNNVIRFYSTMSIQHLIYKIREFKELGYKVEVQ